MCRQKMSAIRKGSPVCPEKNRSPVNIKFFIKSDNAIRDCVGNGPICVRLIAIDRVNTKSDIVLRTNGIFHGKQKHNMITYPMNAMAQVVNRVSTSYTPVWLNTISVTALLAAELAYSQE